MDQLSEILLIDENIDKEDRIYTCFNFNELYPNENAPLNVTNPNHLSQVAGISGTTPTEQGHVWGNHRAKPIAQVKWESIIKNEITGLTGIDNSQSDGEAVLWIKAPQHSKMLGAYKRRVGHDIRPRLYDPKSGYWILVDTGAMCSVWPAKDYSDATYDANLHLEAVNKSRINPYGKRTRQIKLGRKSFNKEMILGDIEIPVLGWDFIHQFKLSLVWSEDGSKLCLVDKKACISAQLKVDAIPDGADLNLAPIEGSYKSFSNLQRPRQYSHRARRYQFNPNTRQ